MSDFDDEFTETATPEFLTRMGDAVVYIDADGVETDLTAMLGAEQMRPVATKSGYDQVRWRQITFSRDPAGEYGGIANPATNAHFEIGGEAWSIDSISAMTPGEITMEIFRSAVVEIGRKDHNRGRR